jgi:site-specific DNA-methyltransferase (adenine-specific)
MLEPRSVHCCITSPPYWRTRDYGHDEQFGHEDTLDDYVNHIVEAMNAVKRTLRDDGTLWMVVGDQSRGKRGQMIPWRLAAALEKAGWFFVQDIIWCKRNPMPESVKTRCSRAHEYVLLLAKQPDYYFDAAAIKEKALWAADKRAGRGRIPGAPANRKRKGLLGTGQESFAHIVPMRNKRSWWDVTVKHLPDAHFATFPISLIEPMVLAGAPSGGTVLDPFAGSGSTGIAASLHGRRYILIELNKEYADMAQRRISKIETRSEAAE